jgi:hypothetical protein
VPFVLFVSFSWSPVLLLHLIICVIHAP